MDSLKGKLLLASPQMADPNFHRTVVLIIEHNEEGAFGLVLNRTSDKSLKQVWERVTDEPCDSDQPLHVGGPVGGPLIAVHQHDVFSDLQLLPGVHLATEKQKLHQLVQQKELPYRIYVGYAGWGSGQLESELDAGAWITTAATADYIFFDADDLWKKVSKDLTDSVIHAIFKPGQIPDDPSLN